MIENLEKIAIGSAQFGMKYGVTNQTGKVSESEVADILKYCREMKILTLDTANSYGDAEEILGKNDLSGFKIITKVNTKSSVLEQVNNSLTHLNVKSLYGVLLHDERDLNKIEAINQLKNLKMTSKIEKIGVSIYDLKLIDFIVDECRDFVSLVQLPLNPWSLNSEVINKIAELKKYDIEVHVRSVFLQGLLLNDDYEKLPDFFKKYKTVFKNWNDYVKANNITKIEAVLSLMLKLKNVDMFVFGIDSKEQLNELVNVKILKNISEFESKGVDSELLNPSRWNSEF